MKKFLQVLTLGFFIAIPLMASADNSDPKAKAGPDRTGYVGVSMIFDGSASYDTDGSIVKYVWTFGDGSTAVGKVVSHTYTKKNTYEVKLKVTDNKGDTDSDTADIEIKSAPVVSTPTVTSVVTTTPTPIPTPTPAVVVTPTPTIVTPPTTPVTGRPPVTNIVVQARGTVGTNMSMGSMGSYARDGASITAYSWNLGDGTTGTESIINHIYTLPGTYTVSLTIRDSRGQSTTKSVQITVDPLIPLTGDLGSVISVVNNTTSSRGGEAITRDFSGNIYIAGRTHTIGTAGLGYVAKYSPSNTLLWQKTYGGITFANNIVKAIGIDISGNLYISGHFFNSIVLDGESPDSNCRSMITAGGTDIFIAKISPIDGSCIWAKRFGAGYVDGFGAYTDEIKSMAVDQTSGDVVIAGKFMGSVNFGGTTFTHTAEDFARGFVARYNENGTHLWSREFAVIGTNTSSLIPNSLAIDSMGDVIVGGVSGSDLFMGKYSGSTGNSIWTMSYPSPGTRPDAIALDDQDNIIVTGSYGSVNPLGKPGTGATPMPSFAVLWPLGIPPQGSQPTSGAFIAKYYGSNGNHVWSKGFPGVSPWNTGSSVAIDENTGNITMVGNTYSTNFGGGTNPRQGLFYANFDSVGTHRWSNIITSNGMNRTGNPMYQTASGVVLDSEGNPIIVGRYANSVDFGTGPLNVAPGSYWGTYILKLNK